MSLLCFFLVILVIGTFKMKLNKSGDRLVMATFNLKLNIILIEIR
jgi:hypothetical protein